MFIDQAKLTLIAGKGGDGAISLHREKYVDRGGPDGGNGGRGGSIIMRADSGVTTLIAYRFGKTIKAPEGQKGGKNNAYGRSGQDVYLTVPVGTVVYQEPEHIILADFTKHGEEALIAKGGKGGRGNACFKSPQVRVPRFAENGTPGEKKSLILELKLLADVGIIGLPNAGKSTLLSIISSAKPEIGDYPFTTINPQLGVVMYHNQSFVAADMPGLIAGAAEGKGLGLRFLRHIERTRVLVHLVSMENAHNPYQDYLAIRQELDSYGLGLQDKIEIVVASKMDEDGAEEQLKAFKKKLKKTPVFPLSALTNLGLDELLNHIVRTLENAPSPLLVQPDVSRDVKIYDASTMLAKQPLFTIRKVKNGYYAIEGEEIIAKYRLYNLSDEDGIRRLLYYLNKAGVDAALAKTDIQDGDTVLLDDFEFEYFR
ncbi:MAG: GTPase ObgE [Bacilli bacterium]